MTAGHRRPPSVARARILDTATRLFYARGLRAVGVDTIIAESGVAKATFYKYFPAKDDLIAAYLDRVDEMWSGQLHAAAEAAGHGAGRSAGRPLRRTRLRLSAGRLPRLRLHQRRGRDDAGHRRSMTAPSRTSRRCWPGCATWRGTRARRSPKGSPARSPCCWTARSPTARSTPTRRPSRWPGIPRPTWSSRLSPPEGRPPSRGRAGSTACRSLTAGPRGTETARPERNLLPVPARQFRCARRSRLG